MGTGAAEDVEKLSTDAQGKRTSTWGRILRSCPTLIACVAMATVALCFVHMWVSLDKVQEENRRLRNDMMVLTQDVRALKQEEGDSDAEGYASQISNAVIESEMADAGGYGVPYERAGNRNEGAQSDDVTSGREKRDTRHKSKDGTHGKKAMDVFHLEGMGPSETEKGDERGYEKYQERCFRMLLKENGEGVRTQTSSDTKDYDNIIRCWQVPEWAESPGFEYDSQKGTVTVKSEGVYYIYVQIFYVKYTQLMEKLGYGIHLNENEEAIFKCVTQKSESVEWASDPKRKEYHSCHTGGSRPLNAGDRLTVTNAYNRSSSGYMMMLPHLSFWGMFKVQDTPGVAVHHHELKQEVEQLITDMDEVRGDMDEVRADMKKSRADMNRVKADMEGGRADMDEVIADMNEVKVDMDEVIADVEKIRHGRKKAEHEVRGSSKETRKGRREKDKGKRDKGSKKSRKGVRTRKRRRSSIHHGSASD